MSRVHISIADDFSKHPGARFAWISKWSGEEFRDTLLIPAIAKADKVVVNLDGTKGLGSGFLEEAFGGAVRAGCEINSHNLRLLSEDAELISDIWSYINDAKYHFADVGKKVE